MDLGASMAWPSTPEWVRTKIESVMTYRVVLQQSEEGYSVSCPGLPGCWSQGATETEALDNIRSAIQECLETMARS
ncbi:MAG: type II toxin-antitoxin system HicB family antitoxin [Acidobacteriaceae bacterium]